MERRIPASWQIPIHNLSATSMVWSISTGQLALVAWLLSLPAPAPLLISWTWETGKSPWFHSNNWKYQCYQCSSHTISKPQHLHGGKLTLSQPKPGHSLTQAWGHPLKYDSKGLYLVFKGGPKSSPQREEAEALSVWSHRVLLLLSKLRWPCLWSPHFFPALPLNIGSTQWKPHSLNSGIISSWSNSQHFFLIFHTWTAISNTGNKFMLPQNPQGTSKVRTRISASLKSSPFFPLRSKTKKKYSSCQTNSLNKILVSELKFCFRKSKLL